MALPLSEVELRAIFDQFDSDKSGSIDSSELVHAIRRIYGNTKSEDDIKTLAAVSLNCFTNKISCLYTYCFSFEKTFLYLKHWHHVYKGLPSI